MTCRISEDGTLAVCGGGRRRQFYHFSKNRRAVFYCDSLWYEPNLILKRKKHERIDLFERRVKAKLKFLPMTFRGWWRVTAVPQLRAL
jgi:hypothetical protein